MDGNDFMKEMQEKKQQSKNSTVRGKKGKQSSSLPVEDIAANQNNELPKPQKKDVPNPVSSPYIAMTQSSDYNTTPFKKRRVK